MNLSDVVPTLKGLPGAGSARQRHRQSDRAAPNPPNYLKYIKRSAPVLGAAMLIVAGLSAPAANAAYIVTLTEVGSNVVATGGGSLNVSGLTLLGTSNESPEIAAKFAILDTGSAGSTDVYAGVAGPANFGNGNPVFASSASGSIVGIDIGLGPQLEVPRNYVSGSALANSATYLNATFNSLGLTPGTYVYTFGTGANADTFTVQIGPAAASVPEPATALLLTLPFGLIGLLTTKERRASRST